jgi:hypothetical protein
MKQQSALMRFFRWLGLDSIAWSLRRFHCPVPPGALVLELGSGARPYYRSNVLCDAFMTNQQRSGLSLVADRPLVLGFAERLPFKDDAFDYLICSYIFEPWRSTRTRASSPSPRSEGPSTTPNSRES